MDYHDEIERALARATKSLTPEELYKRRIQEIATAMKDAAINPCLLKPRRSQQGRR